ncbi:MAG: LysM peptidoglycan-binding domain-containing protein [Chloroflexi bacterium]|nr:LysM peptidoglycan-binding domain-containing protein [Chloroflexota bacterium]
MMIERRVALFLIALLIVSLRVPASLAQGPAPADEPTKPPYVFPTPIFIPTYPGDTVAPTAPRPAATPASSQPSAEGTYTVEPGDSPWTISQRVYGSGAKYAIIMAANGITDSTRLKVGMVLKIPSSDASGQALPTAVPTLAPTLPAPPAPPTTAPTPRSTSPTPTATRTPAPGSASSGSASISDAALLVVNVLSGIFFGGSILSAISAVLMYRRQTWLKSMARMARRIRPRP